MNVVKSSDAGRPQGRAASTPKLSRREQAAVTRERIIESARREFTTNGYQATTMGAIASRAGVAVQTVHFVFHTKIELLRALVDHAVLGPASIAPEDAPWFRAVTHSGSPQESLAAFIEASAPVMERAGGLNEVVREASRLDAEAEQLFHRLETLRLDAYRSVLMRIAAAHRMPADFDLDTATDVLSVFFSPRTYLSLTEDRGWDVEQATELLVRTVPPVVLGELDGSRDLRAP